MEGNRGRAWVEFIKDKQRKAGAPSTPTTEPFTVNGVTLLLRTLSPERLAALHQWSATTAHTGTAFAFKLVAASVIDEAGDEMLTPAEVGDLDPIAVRAILDEIRKRNKL